MSDVKETDLASVIAAQGASIQAQVVALAQGAGLSEKLVEDAEKRNSDDVQMQQQQMQQQQMQQQQQQQEELPIDKDSDRGGIDSLRWVWAKDGHIPPFAVDGGKDMCGQQAYVGRAKVKGQLLTGQVVPKTKRCYIALDNYDNPQTDYEVLTNPKDAQLVWVHTQRGTDIPQRAVPGGSLNGVTQYIGRRNDKERLLMGRVDPPTHKIWFTNTGDMDYFQDFEVLTCSS